VLSVAGERGLSAVVASLPEGLFMMLQSRGVNFEDKEKIEGGTSGLSSFINLSETLAIKYCPFCGKRIEELVMSSHDEFQVLSEKHFPYYQKDLEVVLESNGN
jgi:hypothetical protein